ncbi:competence protein ComF [Staphylococcus succinus]|nr:competence protein ComF [Staphylococcus succinus]PTI41786.1 DNA/RNA helicase [Staphylococcus succinus]
MVCQLRQTCLFLWRSSSIKHYGKLITDQTKLSDELIKFRSKGVIKKAGKWRCCQCNTVEPKHFYEYFSKVLGQTIVYCRNCINLGRMDNIRDIYITESRQQSSEGRYNLSFELSEQQLFASSKIVNAFQAYRSLILYAVTGAGKTEMTFEGIKFARQRGDNIAIVSPRVDVVLEVSLRMKEAFQEEYIDILYQGQRQRYNGHFVIATIHQLYRFKHHFDVIIVDEVDAFPLSMDPSLMHAITAASKKRYSHIYMTATPPRKLLRQMRDDTLVTLPARFHRHALPLPKFKYYKIQPYKIQYMLLNLLMHQIRSKRYTLVFFNHIQLMKQMYAHYKKKIASLTYVHSEDSLRFEKIRNLRRGKYHIIFTTTILERGFTMANLDVIVMHSHTFDSSALIQIAGRVGRKAQAPSGLVLFFHEGITLNMLKARHNIRKMNTLARRKGWIDD